MKVAATHHREDMPCTRIDGDEGCFERARFVQLREPCRDRLVGLTLQLHVDRGINPQPAFQDIFGAELLHHLTPHGF